MEDFQILRMNKSPFYKESYHGSYVRGQPMAKVDFRLPKTAHDDLIRYFKANGLSKSEGFNQMVSDKLAMINTSKRTVFNQVEAIMLIPRCNNLERLNDESRIIALINTEADLIDGFHHQGAFNKSFNYQYELMPFYEDFFPMDLINATKESQVKRVNMGDLKHWDSLYARLDELYGLDGTEWDFVRFPLNNYLDINREGQFQSPRLRGDHRGVYIFDDFNRKRLFCIIDWSYSLENKNIIFDVEFIPMLEFMPIIEKADFKPLRESYGNLRNSDYDKRKLKEMIENEERMLDFLKRNYEKL